MPAQQPLESALQARQGEQSPQARRIRVIPTLLIDERGRLVKTVRFRSRTYIGDPINAVKIFNTKEVDELILLDIDATRLQRDPNYALIEDIVSEAFMPVAYGGGIRSMENVERLYRCGIEKVILSSCLAEGTDLVTQVAQRYGRQAVVVCLPVKHRPFGEAHVYLSSGSKSFGKSTTLVASNAVKAGAGELMLYSIDRDGTYSGYDIAALRQVSDAVEVPVVACGGARNVDDFRAAAAEGGCSAVAAGSVFVYRARGQGVLISYPTQVELMNDVFSRLARQDGHS